MELSEKLYKRLKSVCKDPCNDYDECQFVFLDVMKQAHKELQKEERDALLERLEGLMDHKTEIERIRAVSAMYEKFHRYIELHSLEDSLAFKDVLFYEARSIMKGDQYALFVSYCEDLLPKDNK